ncbi:uncharacterized protein [Physcomitrium patens]
MIPREELMAEIMNMARKALEEWEKILGPEDFQEWSARGYPPKEPASTNVDNMDTDRFLQSGKDLVNFRSSDRMGNREAWLSWRLRVKGFTDMCNSFLQPLGSAIWTLANQN